jgi:Xaa-Pro aminopeptidase
MRDAGVAAMLISDVESVRWVSGFSGSSGFVLMTPTDGRFITDSRYTIQAAEEVKELPTFTFASPVEAADFLKQQAEEMGLQALAFENTITYATYENWKKKFAPIELSPAPDLISGLRMVKGPEEIANIREACKVADKAFEHVTRLIQPGVTEWDLSLEIEFFIRRQGLELGFPAIVVSGERSARPHGKPSEKKLENRDFVTMDFGARVNGYCSDITRTVVVGEATDRHEEIYNQVLKAQLAALDAIKPGVAARDVDALARRVLDEIGLAQYFGHGLGHGLGVVHDAGRMNATSEAVFEPGQVWTVEPGVYMEGFGGVRIEDDVVVTDGGIEILTASPKELLILPR